MTSPSTPVRILVVDDDAMSRELLSALFELQGYKVLCADSGAHALQLLHDGCPAPQVVLADIQMPGIFGSELATALRRQCGPSTLLLAMSGSGPSPEIIAAFDGFLLKPFNMNEVKATISSLAPTPPAPAAASYLGMNTSVHEEAAPIVNAYNGNYEGEKSDTPILDEQIFKQLAEAMPGPQLKQMYAMCMRDARERIATMRRFAEEKNEIQFGRQAHAIKGGSGMLGASEIYGIAAKLETFGLHASTQQGVNPLDELSSACDRLERILGSRL